MKNYYQIPSRVLKLAFKNQHFTPNRLNFSILVMLIIMLSGSRTFAQIDTVIIAADYCSVPGSVQLTAIPSPSAASYTYTWNTNPVQTSPVIQINEAGNYIVTVNDGSGNEKSAAFIVSANLVYNGDFELGNTGFTSSYLYVTPAPAALEPENRYTIDWDPHFSHKFFWGRDHTTNSGKFMIVNGVDQSATVWSQQINGILPNTDYYFSAYGISLNNSQPFANLQFSINGTQVGSITGPLPPHQSNNNPPYDWVQFYGTWNSGNNTTANLSITDLEPSLRGNDFGLDDISFGTLTPFPMSLEAQSNTPCEGDFLQLTSKITGGLPPFTYTWNGPNGFTSDQANPVINNVTQAVAGTYTLKVTDANSCLPVSKDVVVSVNPPSVGGTVTGGSDICVGANSALLTLSGHTGSVVKWQSSVAPFILWTDIVDNNSTYTSGPLSETTRFRAVVQLGSCSEANSAYTTVKVENTAPIISKQAENKTVECDGNGNINELNAWLLSNGGAEATDNSSAVSWTNDFSSISRLCGNSGSAIVTFTAKDACGNSATTSAIFSIIDNTPPVIATLPAPSTINCPAVPEFATAIATDECSADVTLTFEDVKTEGSCAGYYSITRTWTATDACGNSSKASQTINVQDITAPVIAELPAPSTINCPAVPEFATAIATDECSANVTLTFEDVKTEGSCAGSYSITRTWTATDACGNSSKASQTINVQDITAPVIAELPAPSTINCPAVPEFATAIATDECSANVTLTFEDVKTEGSCAGTYSITRTWTATDACGNSSKASQTINVQDITAPVIAELPAPSTINCPAVPEFATAVATDECSANVTLTFEDVKTDGSCAGSYSITRTWTATDACGNSSKASQTINVQDITAPVIAELPAPSTINCPAVPEFVTAIATDECSANVTLTFEDVKTVGNCAGNYSITRTWTATDACGNSSKASQTINVQDITAPVIAELPAPSTINCPAVPEFATATATDECSANVTLTFEDVKTEGSCAGSYSITRTWTATDACGNSSKASQTINVQDITAPVITCTTDVVANNDPGKCGAVLSITKPSVTETCGSYTLTNSINQTDDASGEYPVGTTLIVWTAKDGCGNSSTCTMSVTVNDTEKPVISCAADINICAGNQPVLVNPTAIDNCGIATITNNAPAVFETGTTLVLWAVTDIHGNVSNCTQTVNIAPPLTADAGPDDKLCSAIPYTISNAAASNYTSVTWSHNGHGNLSATNVINPVYTPSAGETGTIEFTLIAKGNAGCGIAEVQDKFSLIIYAPLTVNAGENSSILSGATTTLHGTASGGSGILSYNWTPADKLVDNSKLNPVTLPLFSTTTFTLNVVDALSACTLSDAVTVSVDDVARPIARDDHATTNLTHTLTIDVQQNDTDPVGLGLISTIAVDPKHGNAGVNENGTITYTNPPNYTGKDIYDTLTYTICDKGTPVKCSSAKVFILIPFEREEEIEIFNLVTPNGDGENDYWHIEGIDNTENEIKIFNRWGDKIVKTFINYNNSGNRWEGKNDKNEILPDGVYFYIIKIKDKETKTGWIYLRGKGSN